MGNADNMIEGEPGKFKGYKVGNTWWPASEINELRDRVSRNIDHLEQFWSPFKKINGNGDARSQAFVRDAGEELVKDVAELGAPVTDTNKDAGVESGVVSRLAPEPQS